MIDLPQASAVAAMTPAMRRDLVLSPFGGDSRALLDAAVRAEAEGWDGVWIFDHISSLASLSAPGEGASRDPFTLLGAIAARTERVRLGVLVANIANRHPAQLALAVDTLSGLAPGRVVCGIGAGAGPGSPFAREDDALRRHLAPASVRRERLADYLRALRAIWAGRNAVGTFATEGLVGVVSHPAPPIIVGGGTTATLTLAADLADGANIVMGLTPNLPDHVDFLRDRASRARPNPDHSFEISVLITGNTWSNLTERHLKAGIDRLTVLART